MKLKQLKLKNFAQFEDFEIVFNDDITHLVGINGSGKTTVGLNAIWAGFKGIAEKSKDALIGERYRFISPGKKSLDIEITLHDDLNDYDVILKRHITKDVNQISISSSKESSITKEFVENLLNVTFLSASHFTSLSGKEQALALGIDTELFDIDIVNIKNDAKLIRKQIKAIGEIPELFNVEKVSVSELIGKREEIRDFNEEQTIRRNKIDSRRLQLEEIRTLIADYVSSEKELLEEIKVLPKVKDFLPINSLDDQIANAEETNEKAVIYESSLLEVSKKIKLEKDLENNKTCEESKLTARLEYIKAASLGMKGLTVDDTGSLLMNDKPIKSPYFSKGEIEMIVANIASGLNPDLKVRFIDDFEMLDEENQRKIIKGLTKRGFQIITATVGDKKTRDNSVLLRQCKIVDELESFVPGKYKSNITSD